MTHRRSPCLRKVTSSGPTWFVSSVLLLPLFVLWACGKDGQSSPTSPTPPTSSSIAGCEIRGSTSGAPVTDLLSHNVAVGAAADGVTVTGAAEVLAGGSVPDGVRLPDGSTGVYYVNAQTDGVWLGVLSGSTLTPVSAITIDGVLRPLGVVDPDATAIGGGIRLAYLNGFGPPGSGAERAICLAESTDGLVFRTLATAWRLGANAAETDPSIVQLQSGTWLMALSRGTSTLMGRSSDGLSFTQYDALTFGGVPELALTADGRVRLYVCGAGGIQSYVSADAGSTWMFESTVMTAAKIGRRIVCDPSYVAGAGLFLFKTQG